MLIKVDTRETTLLQMLLLQTTTNPAFQHIRIKSEPLPIGDLIINDGTEDKLVIERKSVADLLSSIKDGRYEEQSYRLNGLPHHNHNIVYLIEGDITKYKGFVSANRTAQQFVAYSAMFSLNYYKGFSLFRSISMEETAMMVCNMAYKMERDTAKGKQPYYSNGTANGTATNVVTPDALENADENAPDVVAAATEKDYVGVIKKVKKDNITPDNIGEIMLCQIPGISSVTAVAVMEKYKTLPNLIKELEQNADAMADLSYANAKGQVRKINKTSIANIVKYLLKK